MLKEISVLELKEKIDRKDDFIIIDVRRSEELEICQIPNVIHIEMNEIASRLNELDPDKEYAILCRSGNRSHQVTAYMMQNDFTNVANIRGGILDWADKLDPSMQKY
jgi:adenylyltransferase/sulfurtransferase